MGFAIFGKGRPHYLDLGGTINPTGLYPQIRTNELSDVKEACFFIRLLVVCVLVPFSVWVFFLQIEATKGHILWRIVILVIVLFVPICGWAIRRSCKQIQREEAEERLRYNMGREMSRDNLNNNSSLQVFDSMDTLDPDPERQQQHHHQHRRGGDCACPNTPNSEHQELEALTSSLRRSVSISVVRGPSLLGTGTEFPSAPALTSILVPSCSSSRLQTPEPEDNEPIPVLVFSPSAPLLTDVINREDNNDLLAAQSSPAKFATSSMSLTEDKPPSYENFEPPEYGSLTKKK